MIVETAPLLCVELNRMASSCPFEKWSAFNGLKVSF